MNKKRLILFATSFILASSSINISINKEKSNKLSKHITEYSSTISNDNFQIGAHRGFSSLKVENTKESITLAAKKDYIDYIEMDIRITKDKKLVLSHDNTIYSSNNKKEEISNTKYKKIITSTYKNKNSLLNFITSTSIESELKKERKRKLHDKSYNIIGLKEGIKNCKRKKILLDLKCEEGKEKEFIKILQKELENIDTSNIVLQSLNLDLIRLLQKETNYNTIAIIKEEKDLHCITEFSNIAIHKDLTNYKLVKKLLKGNKELAIWTINSSKELEDIKKESKDLYKKIIYITDYPDLIATKLNEEEKIKQYQK